jgi:hypothetical protein
MRVNAPISALLAIAALYLFPVVSLANPTHRHAHKTTVGASTRRKSSARPAHAPSRHTSAATTMHVKSQPTNTRRNRHRAIHSVALSRATERPRLRSVEDEASTPVILPTLYNRRGRLIMPPPLRGSHDILVHQNQVAEREGLDRIQNDEDLINLRSERLLVSLPATNTLQIDERLPVNRRYCRPWTAEFLAALASAHYAHFHTPLQVNSAVRTVEFQQHLLRINGNAAPAEGDIASPHLTGQAIDIAKHGLSLTEIAWLRGYLLPLVQEGKVDVEEEFQQACFHISVYKKYLPSADAPDRNPPTSHHSETTALATALR